MWWFIWGSAIALSLDGLTAGMSLGFRSVKIPFISYLWIAMISCGFAGIALWFGEKSERLFSPCVGQFLGASVLILLGIRQLYQAFHPFSKKQKHKKRGLLTTFHLWGLTVQILREPANGDLDHSGEIDVKEAILLGFCLSVDMLGAGIGLSISGIVNYWIALLVGIMQSANLVLGEYLGKQIKRGCPMNSLWESLSGGLLCLLGLLRWF